ncbi:MAG TPA: hypothetical protein VFV17_05465 [Usitatibacteraceae bacterium]|nr:hypothetical protein [Usitatibacteraceae bacterium]
MNPIQNRRKNRMLDADFAALKLIQELEIECTQRMSKIRQNSRMKDVVQLREVTVPEALRAKTTEIRALHQLNDAAEMRMRELLDGHMAELRRQGSVQRIEQLRSHFLYREWSFLKGYYPLLFREAESESEKILRHIEYQTDSRRRGKPGR